MALSLKRLLIFTAVLLQISPALANTEAIFQAKLAYMDLLSGDVKAAYQRIPGPLVGTEPADINSSQTHPALSFALQMRVYGQNKLAIKALERYTKSGISTKQSNQHWLEFGEYFLDSGSIASAEHCLNIISEPIKKKIQAQYYRLNADISLHKLNIDEAEYILNTKWKGRHAHKPYTRLNLATAYADKGNFAAAHAAISQLPKDIPKKADIKERATIFDTALLRVGLAYITSGNFSKAKAFLIKIPVESIYAPRATLGLAWAEIGMENYQKALAPLAHLIDSSANYQQEKQEAYSLLALATSKQKKHGQAASLYLQSQAIYSAEKDALKSYSIPIYSGKTIDRLSTKLNSGEDEFNIKSIQKTLGKPLYSYLFKLLEKDSTKILFKAYYQQSLLLQDLNAWLKKGLLKQEDYKRLSQLMKNSTFKHKDSLIRLLASEVEMHITRLEGMAEYAEFSAGTMYLRVGKTQ